jgi:hypothetical protein
LSRESGESGDMIWDSTTNTSTHGKIAQIPPPLRLHERGGEDFLPDGGEKDVDGG